MRVAFVGVGYFPTRMTSEKNFFLKLISLLRGRVDDVIVISANDQDQPVFAQQTPYGPVNVYNFKRPFHRCASERYYRQVNGVHAYHHRHGPAQELLEKYLTLRVHAARIDEILRRHRIDLLYFMDNFGFGMRWLKVRAGLPTAFVAANYDPRGRLYNRLQRAFLGGLDTVITYSDAYRSILQDIGVPPAKLKVLHWGIDPAAFQPLDEAAKAAARQRHGVAAGRKLVLWTGYIQQIQQEDFYRAAAVAHAVKARRTDVEFIFCFKPETFKSEYAGVAGPGLQVISGSPDFRSLLGASDVLLSPTYKLSSTVSPPLTWTEGMAMGIPVLTTAVLGADEIIEAGRTGFISASYATLADDLDAVLNRGADPAMATAARATIEARYNINSIADQFVKIFGEAK